MTFKQGNPYFWAACLIFFGLSYRLIASFFPELLLNASPLLGLALVSGAYLPRAWGWIVAPLVIILTDLAFLSITYRTEGHYLSWQVILPIGFYAGIGYASVLLTRKASLYKFWFGSLVGSILFYLLANTVSWWGNVEYAQSWSGWIQANTTGIPLYPPSWMFLRNALLGDLFFTTFLVALMDFSLFRKPFLLERQPVYLITK